MRPIPSRVARSRGARTPEGRTRRFRGRSWLTLLERTPNRLLGVGPDALRVEHACLVPPGSTLLLYTDGLVERRGVDLDDGLAWLCQEVAVLRHLPVDELCDRLLSVLPDELDDDVALLALRAHRAG